MYNNEHNSKTYDLQLKSLKKTQYIGLGGHFSDLGKIGFKTQKLSFCQLNCGQKRDNFKKLKEVFVKNISIFNPMVLSSINENCMDCGMHFSKPSFEYLHIVFYITT